MRALFVLLLGACLNTPSSYGLTCAELLNTFWVSLGDNVILRKYQKRESSEFILSGTFPESATVVTIQSFQTDSLIVERVMLAHRRNAVELFTQALMERQLPWDTGVNLKTFLEDKDYWEVRQTLLKDDPKKYFAFEDTIRQMGWAVSDKGRARFEKMIDEWVAAAVSRYSNRRTEWKTSFFDSLQAQAHDHDNLLKSAYIIVRRKGVDGRPGEIIGALRVITHSYMQYEVPLTSTNRNDLREYPAWKEVAGFPPRRLPLENYLGHYVHGHELALPRQLLPDDAYTSQHSVEHMRKVGGQQIEVGNFFIEKSMKEKVSAELLFHFLHVLTYQDIGTGFNDSGRIFYTFGNKTSIRLYKKYGFGVLWPEPVEHDGLSWWVMFSTPERLYPILLRLAKKNRELDVKPAEFLDALEVVE